MPLSIVGAGVGRTGTLSLKNALEQLGFGPCFHCLDGPSSLIQRTMSLAFDRRPINWDELFAGYNSAVDAPVSWFYQDIAEKCPSAKFILTVRDPGAWYDSAQALRSFLDLITPPPKSGERVAWETKWRAILSPEVFEIFKFTDRESAVAAFTQFNIEVQKRIPTNRLLIFDVKQGWQPLCKFLNASIPDHPFPRVNHKEEFQSLVREMVERDMQSSKPNS